jgi:hypothetical protein
MTAEDCRPWRESLGAYVLEHLDPSERAGLDAHLDGCADCRAEVASLEPLARLLPFADPEHLGPVPTPPAGLGSRITATIAAERRTRRRRRSLTFGIPALAGAAIAAVLAFVVLSPSPSPDLSRHVTFADAPRGIEASAKLEPQSVGTHVRVYVRGIRGGTLCRVFLRSRGGHLVSAGTFHYRWGETADLTAALPLSRASAIVVHAGKQIFTAPIAASQESDTTYQQGNKKEST